MKKSAMISSRTAERYEFNKYFFWGAFLILLVLSYLILKQYLIALVSAFILAYLVRPIYVRLERKIARRIAAFLCVFFVLIIILLPIGLVVAGVTQQAYNFLSDNGGLGNLLNDVNLSPSLENVNFDVLDRVSDFFLSYFTDFVLSVPSFLVSLFILLFGMYYILIDWDSLSYKLKGTIPFREKEMISKDIAKVTNVLVYGTLLMAFIEFVVAVIGFYALGVKFHLLLAVLVFFFAFIPGVGPAFVWAPLSLYYLYTGDYFIVGGLLFVGLVLSVGLDIIFRAKVLGGKSKINPLVMILGILGGISVFGIFGFIIGPLVLAYTLEILEEVGRKR
ncbi:MAG: AI-2E family transporter [archaeon]